MSSASSELFRAICIESLCVCNLSMSISHSSPVEFIFWAHKFILKEGVVFDAQTSEVRILEVA